METKIYALTPETDVTRITLCKEVTRCRQSCIVCRTKRLLLKCYRGSKHSRRKFCTKCQLCPLGKSRRSQGRSQGLLLLLLWIRPLRLLEWHRPHSRCSCWRDHCPPSDTEWKGQFSANVLIPRTCRIMYMINIYICIIHINIYIYITWFWSQVGVRVWDNLSESLCALRPLCPCSAQLGFWQSGLRDHDVLGTVWHSDSVKDPAQIPSWHGLRPKQINLK